MLGHLHYGPKNYFQLKAFGHKKHTIWLVADSPDCVAPPRNRGAMPRRQALSGEPSPTP
jgi:hypothetical protein